MAQSQDFPLKKPPGFHWDSESKTSLLCAAPIKLITAGSCDCSVPSRSHHLPRRPLRSACTERSHSPSPFSHPIARRDGSSVGARLARVESDIRRRPGGRGLPAYGWRNQIRGQERGGAGHRSGPSHRAACQQLVTGRTVRGHDDGSLPASAARDRKSTRLNSSHEVPSRMPSSA